MVTSGHVGEHEVAPERVFVLYSHYGSPKLAYAFCFLCQSFKVFLLAGGLGVDT